MPHVYAATVHGIFYGYGYAVAQDRLFQMEMARRATQGKTAEVLGPSMVAFDKSIRGNFSPERIQRQLAAMSPEDRQILDGYAAGMPGSRGCAPARPPDAQGIQRPGIPAVGLDLL